MEISETGFWNLENPDHSFDQPLCRSIYFILRDRGFRSLVDLGCGDGSYIKLIRNNGIFCEGYDGNPNTVELSGGVGKIIDLSEKIDLGKKYDCVLSLEVGEHIPQEFEQNFINNIVNHSKQLLIVSWAIPGQGGRGHVNERENRYIIDEFGKRNFHVNKQLTVQLRNQSTIAWFKRTIMVFENGNNSIINN